MILLDRRPQQYRGALWTRFAVQTGGLRGQTGGFMNGSTHAFGQPTVLHRPQVALVDLPPVYRRGLGAGPTEAGYVVQQPSDLVAWAGDGSGTKIAVTTDTETA